MNIAFNKQTSYLSSLLGKLAGLLFLIIFVFSTPLLADIRGTDINGKPVILRGNGTWSYVLSPPTGNANSCRAYANNAIAQQRLNQSRRCGFGGVHWHLDYNRHYNWCMGVSTQSSNSGTLSRDITLKRCIPKPPPTGNANSCRAYATNAIAQQRLNQNRRCGFGGVHWHLDYNKHYNWCMRVSARSSNSGTLSRDNTLKRCAGPNVGGKQSYLGCFIDKPDRDIKGYSFNSSQLTNQTCISTCKAKGYRIAATQFRSYCFCGNSFGRYGKASNPNECSLPCAGNKRAKCGGSWRNSVFNIGTGTVSPPSNQQTFVNPKWKGHIVDNCVTWATTCGGGGADYFCRLKGYKKSYTWKHNRPGTTYVIGSNRVCRGQFCVGYSSISCTR